MHKYITIEKVKEIVRSRRKMSAIIRASYNSKVVHNQLISGMQIIWFYGVWQWNEIYIYMDENFMLIMKSGQIGNEKLLFKYSYIIYEVWYRC